ncbi:helix-turn-helix domain-containing protein [Escherichia coli]|uniref:helix-turn-helix domain-containing protein n=1 Tax=Escherichia coli TaxID=562 RepID=UPI001CCECCBC
MQFTQQELADLIGTSRVTVANLVNDLIQQGYIIKDGRYYIIPSVNNILPNE